MFQRTTVVKIIASLSVWKLAYPAENFALKKPAVQSSTWLPMTADRTVDGGINGNSNLGSCSHTAGWDFEPWLLVDLMRVYLVNYVVIYNRNTYQERLDNTYVEGFLNCPLVCNRVVPQLCAHHPGPSGDVVNLTCVQEIRARYIRLRTTGILSTCEVEVYGPEAEDQGCSKRTVLIEQQDGRRLPVAIPTVDLGHANNSRDCSYLCLQRPECHVYNYNNLTGDCTVPQSLFNNYSEVSPDWTLYSIC